MSLGSIGGIFTHEILCLGYVLVITMKFYHRMKNKGESRDHFGVWRSFEVHYYIVA